MVRRPSLVSRSSSVLEEDRPPTTVIIHFITAFIVYVQYPVGGSKELCLCSVCVKPHSCINCIVHLDLKKAYVQNNIFVPNRLQRLFLSVIFGIRRHLQLMLVKLRFVFLNKGWSFG
ncbi:serine/threonine-protein phosphatase 5 [Platysternon megacephalum]|uniref:Serine/threonine-protein phosphatase 5 n=1 Tax=Platysternon megacephalum TaxID=55544 RepID=A0A4D9DRC4_9SAUR|nr:serine/threonine-protein phosphatase 5 [Platysternon megacephalum]